jgi:hypothetical protein
MPCALDGGEGRGEHRRLPLRVAAGGWAQGCHNTRQIYHELAQPGYRGSASLVSVDVRPWRTRPQGSPPVLTSAQLLRFILPVARLRRNGIPSRHACRSIPCSPRGINSRPTFNLSWLCAIRPRLSHGSRRRRPRSSRRLGRSPEASTTMTMLFKMSSARPGARAHVKDRAVG